MVVLSDKLVEEKVWLNKSRYSDAEKSYYEKLAKLQKEGEDSKESSPDNVKNETKTEASPKKRRKRNSSNKEEQVPNRNPPGTKDIPAKRNSVKEKKNVKFDKDRKESETLPESPMKKVKEPTPPKDPEPEDLAWDAVDTQADTVAPVETKVESEPAVDDKKKKDKKKNKKNDKKGDKGGSGGNQGHAAPLNLNTLASEVAKARHHIKTSLDCINDVALMTSNNMNLDHGNRISQLEKDNRDLKSQVDDLLSVIKKLEGRIASLEKGQKPAGTTPAKPPTPAKAPADDDDDVDLFGSDSDEEDEAAKKVKEQRLAEYSAKKSKKPALIAKSNIILDVKPWDDETDMKEMEKHVREITMDGLLWGASKLVPLAYGIHKLQISCVVEDDKVSVDLLTETIEEIEDYVQSVDIAAFNKV